MGGIASIFLRLAATNGKIEAVEYFTFDSNNMMRIFALCSYGVGFILYSIALQKFNLAIAYPVMTSISVMVAILYTIYADGSLSAYQWVGIFFIVFGVYMLVCLAGD